MFETYKWGSNSDLILNGDGLLARKEVEAATDLIGENKNRIPPQNFKSHIDFYFRNSL